jgi:hypothetical protein
MTGLKQFWKISSTFPITKYYFSYFTKLQTKLTTYIKTKRQKKFSSIPVISSWFFFVSLLYLLLDAFCSSFPFKYYSDAVLCLPTFSPLRRWMVSSQYRSIGSIASLDFIIITLKLPKIKLNAWFSPKPILTSRATYFSKKYIVAF